MGERYMFHIGTIKIAQNINQEMPAQQLSGVKNFQDTSSADGFFNILKNQIQSIEQATAAFSDKFDMLKNDSSVSAAVKEKSPYETANQDKPGEETVQAVGTTAEKAQKTSAQNQEKEARTYDEVKGSLAQKPGAEHESKKALDKDNDADARLRQKQKSKAKDEPDMYELHEGLHRMIDIIKGREQSETRNAKRTDQELNNFFRDLKTNSDPKVLKKTLDKLAALVEKLDAATQGASNREHLAATIAGTKDFLTRLKAALEKNQNQKNSAAADGNISVAKDLLGRIETMLEIVKGDNPYHRTGRDSQGNNDIFNFSHLKGDLSAKHADTPAQPKSGLFRENLDAIIQNAKVFVQDSRNGSFSLRLHPRELGSVNINLGLHDGVVHGKFLVNTQEARDLLLSNLELIKQQLQDAGISVGEFQVNVNDQRGRLLNGGDRDGITYIPPAEHAVEIESEYISNARPIHDGHINLVI
jgi:flagellar hook-length control protein FliK